VAIARIVEAVFFVAKELEPTYVRLLLQLVEASGETKGSIVLSRTTGAWGVRRLPAPKAFGESPAIQPSATRRYLRAGDIHIHNM
jgi:hypothetical protein